MGRPSKQPTDAERAEVAQWVEARVSIEEMARRRKMTSKTFRKHYAAELGISSGDSVITESGVATPPRLSAHQPTVEQREMALILAGAQLSHPEIARKMGVPLDVLKEHYAGELEQGPVKCKADILQAMFYAGKGGNVAAAKVYLVFNGQAPPQDNPDQVDKSQPGPIGLLGKKAAATLGAQGAQEGTAWDGLASPGSKPN